MMSNQRQWLTKSCIINNYVLDRYREKIRWERKGCNLGVFSCHQRSCRTRGCRMCLFSAPEESLTNTGFPPCWRSTSNKASLFTTCPSQTETRLSWSSAARSSRSCRSASRTTGRQWSSEWSPAEIENKKKTIQKFASLLNNIHTKKTRE